LTDIFQEVEEDYRRERYQLLAKRYGPYAIAAVVGLVAMTGAFEAYQSWRTHRMEDAAKAYAAASGQLAKDPKAAAQAFAALAAQGGGYGVLARFREAEALEASGDTGGAVKILDQVAADQGRDKALADLARLKTGYLLLDRQSRADLETRLQPLLAEGNPWRPEAREILAYGALKSGEQAKALEIFKALAQDAASPETLRNRAASMVMALGGQLTPPTAPAANQSQ
jgi:hypothetical protein